MSAINIDSSSQTRTIYTSIYSQKMKAKNNLVALTLALGSSACVNETLPPPDTCDTTSIATIQADIDTELALICKDAIPNPRLMCYQFTCTHYGDQLSKMANITYEPPCTDNLMQPLRNFVTVCLSTDPNNTVSVQFGFPTDNNAHDPQSCPFIFETAPNNCIKKQ